VTGTDLKFMVIAIVALFDCEVFCIKVGCYNLTVMNGEHIAFPNFGLVIYEIVKSSEKDDIIVVYQN
jgi:hypothetical protein